MDREDKTDDVSDTLHWHALNYRTASSQHAEEMWQELVEFVNRMVAAEREACAQIAETAPDFLQNSTFNGVAAAIRARSKT